MHTQYRRSFRHHLLAQFRLRRRFAGARDCASHFQRAGQRHADLCGWREAIRWQGQHPGYFGQHGQRNTPFDGAGIHLDGLGVQNHRIRHRELKDLTRYLPSGGGASAPPPLCLLACHPERNATERTRRSAQPKDPEVHSRPTPPQSIFTKNLLHRSCQTHIT